MTNVVTVNSPTPEAGPAAHGRAAERTTSQNCPPASSATRRRSRSAPTRSSRKSAAGKTPAPVNECPAASAIGVALVRSPSRGLSARDHGADLQHDAAAGRTGAVRLQGGGHHPGLPGHRGAHGRDYGITISSHNIIQTAWPLSVKLTFWGVPGDPPHDAQRGWECLKGSGACPARPARRRRRS